MCLCFLQGCSAASTCLWLVFVEDVDKLFDSFNSVKRAAAGKALRSPLSDSSPHIDQWTKASMGIKSWIFLEDDKPAFKKPTPSQNGWIMDIGAVQHVWRTLKSAGFDYLETRSRITFSWLVYCSGLNFSE